MINRTDINFKFSRIGASDSFNVYTNGDNPEFVGIYSEADFVPEWTTAGNEYTSTDILQELSKYRDLPEYSVGLPIPEQAFTSQEFMIYELERRITGCYCLIYGADNAQKYAERCINWLRSNDFYVAPASTKYHDAEPFGLLKHTLKVINSMYELMQLKVFKDVNCVEATVAAIVHDWCKIDFYEGYLRNVKSDEGVWEQVPSYRCKGSSVPLGHGVTSMFIAQKFFKLSLEQALAIRWHMGEFDVSDSQEHDLMDSNEKYPMVLLLQTADRLSIL